MGNDELKNLLDRFIQNQTSLEEEKRLLHILRDKNTQQKIFAYYQERWNANNDEQVVTPEMQREMWLNIKKRIHEQAQQTENSPAAKKNRLFHMPIWMRYAAVVLLAVTLSSLLVVSYYQSKNVYAGKDFMVVADKGQRASVVLPDGTKVWLNSDSRLTYDVDYGKKDRRVSLSGEGYFEVAKDPEHRFLVNAGNMEIEALGTEFNVKAYQYDKKIVATLFEGSVRATISNGQSALLKPNQSVIYDNENQHIRYGSDRDAAYSRAWRNNEIALNNNTLAEMKEILERSYNVKVEIRSEEIKQYRFSGVIKSNSLNNILEIIGLTAPIAYRFENDTIVLELKE